ncbi:MAG: hypothetical protein UY10_C0009G0012 [Microgenomates group bacterium GW2011_GWA2_47_8]|nr:MAG: hypothetical protein UY10_C0009G0012 [Microgenomates group bacterium GW2011_GWA2_47_8]
MRTNKYFGIAFARVKGGEDSREAPEEHHKVHRPKDPRDRLQMCAFGALT